MRTSRLVEVEKKKKLTTFVTDQYTHDKHGAVSNGVCMRERERERYSRPFEIIFPFGTKISLQRKIISTPWQKAFEKERYKERRDVDSNTMSRLNYI